MNSNMNCHSAQLLNLFILVLVFDVKFRKHSFLAVFFRVTGMPKEKYDPPDPRRCYTIMSAEEAASGKKSHWAELEISGQFNQLILNPLPCPTMQQVTNYTNQERIIAIIGHSQE